MIYIIYKITNLINKKIYIGFTKFSIDERFLGHVKSSKEYKINSLLHMIRGKYTHHRGWSV